MKLLISRGGDSLIKVGTDVWRVQNLGLAQFPQKTLCLGKKSAQKPNDGASFHDFSSAKLENFQQVGHFFHSYQIVHIFGQKLPKPNA